jgi:hypothetical protein
MWTLSKQITINLLHHFLPGINKGGKGPDILSAEEEAMLTEYCLYMADRGIPLRRWMVMALAEEIDLKKEEPQFDQSKGASQGWWRRFSHHHPDLSLRVTSKLDGGRASMAHKSVVEKFFKMVKPLYEAHDITPERIYNLDETGFCKEPMCRERSVCRKGCRAYERQYCSGDHSIGLHQSRWQSYATISDLFQMPPQM